MLVYVLKQNGQPFMPTSRLGKVRRLLKEGKARLFVENRLPSSYFMNQKQMWFKSATVGSIQAHDILV